MDSKITIRYNGVNVYGAMGIRLQPQLNHFGEDKASKVEAFLKHPGVVRRIKSGEIEVVQGVADAAADDLGNKASKQSNAVKKTAKDRIAEVKETLVVDDLNAMLAEEQAGDARTTVIDAINAQLETVNGAKVDGEAGTGDSNNESADDE